MAAPNEDFFQTVIAIVVQASRGQGLSPPDHLAGFHFTLLDWQIDWLVLPLKQRIEARGEHLRVVVRFVDFGASPFEHYQFPAEYGEFMLVVFDHIKSKYGFIPDGIDVMNEPDNVSGWTGTVIGKVVDSSGAVLPGGRLSPGVDRAVHGQ